MTTPPDAPTRLPFGALLRRFRVRAELSQEMLAEAARISPVTVGALERGQRRSPYRETLALIVAALKLSAQERVELERAADASRAVRRRRLTPSPSGATVSAISDEVDDAGEVAHNLPLALNSFHDREQAFDELSKVVRSRRIVTLVGPGGVGKTRLALEIARGHLRSGAFPEGVWFVELGTIEQPSLVPTCFASGLMIADAADESVLDTVISAIRDRRILVVVDNCEHLVEACAHVVERISRTCQFVSLVSTSREALNVDGEFVYDLAPLAVASVGGGISDGARDKALMESPAAQLFIDRATDIEPRRFPLVAQTEGMLIARICERLDGLPLALELAAARVRDLPLRDIAAGLDDRFALLSHGRRSARKRQQTLRGMVDWSYALLSQQERLLFRRVGIFAASWTLDGARFLCSFQEDGGEASLAIDVRDLLATLVAKSLVVSDLCEGEPARYRLLESVRYYARELLRDAGELESVAKRYAEYAVEGVARADALTRSDAIDDREAAVDLVTDLQFDIRAAIDWSLVKRRAELLGAHLVQHLFAVWNSAVSYGAKLTPADSDASAGGDTRFGKPPTPLFNIADFVALVEADDTPEVAADRSDSSAATWHSELGQVTTYATQDYIFRKNDLAGELYHIVSGTVLLEEFSVRVGANDMLGEVAFFLPESRRTASARCLTDVTARCIEQARLREVFEREPMLRARLLHAFGEHMLADLIRAHDARSLAHSTIALSS